MKLIQQKESVQTIDHVATGANARKARLKTKLSLRDMAKLLKISAPFLSDLELGRRNWTEELVTRYTKQLKNKP